MLFKSFNAIAVLLLMTLGTNITFAEQSSNSWQSIRQTLAANGIAAESINVMIQQAQRRKMVAQDMASLIKPVTIAKQQGLPVAPIINRIQQGLAKGIPAGRINRAVNELTKNLQWGKQLVARHVSQAELRNQPELTATVITNLEVARRQNFKAQQLEHIFADSPLKLTQMAKSSELVIEWTVLGVNQEKVSNVLRQALQAGMDSTKLSSMNKNFAPGLQKGQDVDEMYNNMQQQFNADQMQNDIGSSIQDEMQNDIGSSIQDEMQNDIGSSIQDDMQNDTAGSGGLDQGGAGGF